MFQSEYEAKHFLKALERRFNKFDLELEPTKTRILPFGRFKGTKESFDFLGFTFYNGKTTTGKYRPIVKTSKKKMKQKKENVKKWLHDKMHESIAIVGESLKRKVLGHYAYYGINGNYKALVLYYKYIKYTWYRVLRKRGQKNKIKYLDYLRIWQWIRIPEPRVCIDIW